MIQEARAYGLVFADEAIQQDPGDPRGTIHNPLWPFWWLLGWRRRFIPFGDAPPRFHASVQERLRADPEFAKRFGSMIPENAMYEDTSEDE